jgi:SH3-like domain-containing protein
LWDIINILGGIVVRIVCPVLMFLIFFATQASAVTKSIGREDVNVRSGPSLQDTILFKATLGYPMEVREEKNRWVYCTDWEGDAGWVYKPLLSNTPTVIVSVEKANIRSSAGTGHTVLSSANKGEIYRLLDRKGKWVKIGYYSNGEALGWVRRDLIFGD